MIAACPRCSARYRVDTARVGPEGAKLRCTKCSALFLVRVPEASAAAVTAPAARPVPATPGAPATSAAAPVPAVAPTTSAAGDRRCVVLVADPDAARGKASVDAIRRWGVSAEVVHDGVEAMLAIQRMLPRAVVLDAALPRMYGFQVCEIVKRNESLKHITVVLVGAVHDQSRYRRDPSDLYGADVFLEQPDLPDGLEPLLRGAGLLPGAPGSTGPTAPRSVPVPPSAPAAPTPAPIAQPAAPRAPIAPPAAPAAPKAPIAPPAAERHPAAAPAAAAGSEDPAREEERERARRLARIAVSEMLLYQPDKFAQACREGTLERVLDAE
ncbi:MAG: zinc-ribbon domain-containing protein, partial [Myxococcota bacterium]